MDNTTKTNSPSVATEAHSEKPDAFTTNFKKELPAIVAEFSFVLLPLLVIAILHAAESRICNIFYAPEWSFATSVLFGLTIVKLIMGVAAREHSFHWQFIGLTAALLLVFGLVPSLIVLSVVFRASQPSLGFAIAQLFLFLISTVSFFIFGTIGQMLANTAFQDKIMKMLGVGKKKNDATN